MHATRELGNGVLSQAVEVELGGDGIWEVEAGRTGFRRTPTDSRFQVVLWKSGQ